MANAADILGALPYPAAQIGADGAVRAANAAFQAAGGVTTLQPGDRLETPADGGGSWIWRASALPEGGRMVTAERGAEVTSLGARERYLAALSHELRTPLNGVLGMTGLLGRTRLDADQRTYVAALKDSGEHLLGLVNDVLDLAKLESGQIDLERHPVDAEKLLQGVAELLSPRAYEKGLEIAWAAPEGLPAILADEGRLRQILFNLAGNAIKFTEAGGALLSVRRGADGDGLRLRFSVIDTGPGVPEGEQARVFEEFARVEGPQQRLEGAGLGLAIVRRLAQAHGGAVGLTNRPEGGAEFWFESAFTAAAPVQPDVSLAGVHVAVVTPNPIVARAAATQVEACGGRAGTYDDMASAAASGCAVLLVDHALRKAGRRFKPPAGTRAIVLLAPEDRSRIARLRVAGFDGYLIKPLRRASLAERVLAVLGRGGAEASSPAHEDERIAPRAGAGLKVLLAEDNPINALLARSLLEREGCAVHRAANGREAVDAASVAAYDLILMDLRMPELDGLQATVALRARGVVTPIVALTADSFDNDRRACLAAGMDDFLTKPLDPAALRGMLARWAGFTDAAAEAKLAS